MPMYGSAKKSKAADTGMMPPPDAFTSPLPGAASTIANRMLNLGGSADVAPTWGANMSVPPMPVPSALPVEAPPIPPPIPPLTDPAALPPANVPAPPPAQPPVPPGLAAANPFATATGGEIFGAPIRRGIFRQLYQAGKGLGGAAGESLMNTGKPPMPQTGAPPGFHLMPDGAMMSDAAMGRTPEAPPPPRVPQLPPAPQAPGRDQYPAHLRAAYGRQQPPRQQSGGRAGRLMDRMRSGPRRETRPMPRRAGY